MSAAPERWGAIAAEHEAARALARWQHAAGAYWPYVCAAPFLGRDIAAGFRQSAGQRSRRLVELLGALPRPAGAAVFVDLPPESTLPAVPELNRLGFIAVPVIQRWPAAGAVLPCEALVGLLLAARPERARPAGGAVFLLDGDRAGQTVSTPAPARRTAAARFDNRYAYPICRFPPPAFLLRQGVQHVWWISASPAAEDLLPYREQLSAAGLAPELIELALNAAG